MTEFRIPLKLCPICSKNRKREQGVTLLGHTIPEDALERFKNSPEAILNNDNLVKRYERSLSSRTKPIGIRSLMRSCWILHLTPKEIMSMNPSDLKRLLDDFETYFLENYDNPNPTIDFERFIKRSQCLTISKSLKGFIKVNGVKLSDTEYRSIFKNLFDLPIIKQKDYVPTKEEIRTFYAHAPEHSKILIHFLTNVPLRREELRKVTWKMIDLDKPYPQLTLEAIFLKGHAKGKYQNVHFTSIICESLRKALIDLKEKEKKRFRDNLIPISEEDFENLPIFLSSDCTMNQEGKKQIEPLHYSALGNLFFNLQRKIKIPISAHSFRYYVQGISNKMIGLQSAWTYFFIGHKLPLILASYDRSYKNYDEALENFKKIEPYVDLFYDETKIEDKLKMRFTQLKTEGKTDSEALDTIFKERSQMLVQEMNSFKGVILGQIKKAEEEHKRRTEE